MAIAVVFTPPSMTAAQYDSIIQRLNEAGASAPAGRLYHACFGTDTHMQVLDVWELPEIFEQFGATLMPILQQLGIDPGQPSINPVHNIIKG